MRLKWLIGHCGNHFVDLIRLQLPEEAAFLPRPTRAAPLWRNIYFNVQGRYISLVHQRAPDSVFAKAGRRVYATFTYPGVKVTESIDVERTMETRMDAIAVNLCDLLSPQMKMDGGIPVVPIRRWMRAQPRL